jgi:Mg-chelatase subunit ChlD
MQQQEEPEKEQPAQEKPEVYDWDKADNAPNAFKLKCSWLRTEHAGKYLGPHGLVKNRLHPYDVCPDENDCLNIQHVYGVQIVALIRNDQWGGEVKFFPDPMTRFWAGDRVIWGKPQRPLEHTGANQKKKKEEFEGVIVEKAFEDVKVTKTFELSDKGGLPPHLDNHIIGIVRQAEKDQGALNFRNLTGGQGSIHLIIRRGEPDTDPEGIDFPEPERALKEKDEIHTIAEIQIGDRRLMREEVPFDFQRLMTPESLSARVQEMKECDRNHVRLLHEPAPEPEIELIEPQAQVDGTTSIDVPPIVASVTSSVAGSDQTHNLLQPKPPPGLEEQTLAIRETHQYTMSALQPMRVPVPVRQESYRTRVQQVVQAVPTPMTSFNHVASRRQQARRSMPVLSSPQASRMEKEAESFADDDSLDVAPSPACAAATQPEPEAVADSILAVSTRVEYSALPRGRVQDIFGLVSVEASKRAAEEELPRQPMDIVCVLDVSGSMTGTKIRLVQDAMRFVVEQADPADRVSIVTFNHMASRALRLRKMNAEGKNDATVSVLQMVAGGGTSIAAGLDAALQVMEQRRHRNKVSAILLLTDGQDYSTRPQIPSLVARAQQVGASLYAFGFGADHDAQLLSEVAEQATTPFTFVEDEEHIREAFAGAVGGLSSVVAQKIELRVACHVPLTAVHTPFPVQHGSDGTFTVTIPDMFAGERRDLVVELAASPEATSLLTASAHFFDLQGGSNSQTASVAMEVERCEQPQPEMEPDEEVSAHRERVEVSRALQEAAAESDLGNFEVAREKISAMDKKVKSRKQTKMSAAMLLELEDAQERMASRSAWEQGGRAEVKDAAQMHMMQRCTNMSKSKKSSVCKVSKEMYCSASAQVSVRKSR